MPKERTIKTYSFAELSPKARDKARYNRMASEGYPHADEALESLRKLASHFGGKLRNYEIDWFASSHSSASFDMPDGAEVEIAYKLAQLGDYDKKTFKGNGDCKLTGFASDEDAIDGFRVAYVKGEKNLNALMQAGFRAWLAAAQSDCESLYSDDTMAEMDETEYLENGEYAPQ